MAQQALLSTPSLTQSTHLESHKSAQVGLGKPRRRGLLAKRTGTRRMKDLGTVSLRDGGSLHTAYRAIRTWHPICCREEESCLAPLLFHVLPIVSKTSLSFSTTSSPLVIATQTRSQSTTQMDLIKGLISPLVNASALGGEWTQCISRSAVLKCCALIRHHEARGHWRDRRDCEACIHVGLALIRRL